MGRREVVARSIVRALTKTPDPDTGSLFARLLSTVVTFFRLFDLPLKRIFPVLFTGLRVERWSTGEDEYLSSFRVDGDAKAEDALEPVGDMGYSGSTFFTTADKRYLIKSVPRYFEHSFFRDDLIQPYAAHMSVQAGSLLVRICDFLASAYYPLGSLLGLAPTHHIVMENILYGQDAAASEATDAEWENWDLKPTSYFFPERDIAAGKLASEATKSRLADKFDGKILLTQAQADELLAQLAADTKLLAECNAVDYSLFLVRITTANQNPFADPQNSEDAGELVPDEPPFVPPGPPSWRTGVTSADGKHIFRAAVLDFFWAKHKVQPRVMTALINLWNLFISRQGHMSITTTSDEYRERFLKMCSEIVEVVAS